MKKGLSLFLIICLLLTSIPIMSYLISIAQTADKSKHNILKYKSKSKEKRGKEQ